MRLTKRCLVALSVAAGCSPRGAPVDAGADLAPPPMICRTPAAPPAKLLSDVSEQVGLGAAASPAAQGTSVYVADLDGDGWPDLLSSLVPADRETGGKRSHWLLMNRGKGSQRQFVDATEESGLRATRDGVGGRGWTIGLTGDLDNDGDVDVILCPGAATADDECAAFLNDGAAHFALAPKSDLEGAGAFQCVGGALLDFDRDGLLDYWPGTFGIAPMLFRGSGDGKFKDVAEAMGLPSQNGDRSKHLSYRQNFGVTACDLDLDGDGDVLLADYGREANQVWRNDGAAFAEIGQALGVAFDDRMDFSDDESYRCWCQANPGRCKMGLPPPVVQCPNRGWAPGQSDQPWRLGGNTFGIACGDIDNDGDVDLMTAEIRHWDVGSASDPSELLINPGSEPLARFVRPGNDKTGLARPHTSGWNEGDMMPAFADLDLDGLKDIVLTTSDYPDAVNRLWLWRQKPDHTFADFSTVSGAAHKQPHGLAVADLDRDGDLDLVVGTSTARGVAKNNALRIYRNDLGAANWTQVVLRGGGAGRANRSAIGAVVRVTAGGVTQLQEVQGGYAHEAMQHGFVLTFGLGAACAVEKIEVRWPDAAGTTQTFTDVRANYRVEIVEGESALQYLR